MTSYALRKTQLYWAYVKGGVEIRLGFLENALSDPWLVHAVEVVNVGIPEAVHRTTPLPFLPGTFHDTARYEERVMTLGWVAYFSGPHARKLYDGTLRRHFRLRDDPGVLRAVVYDDDGYVAYERAIDCYYQSGLEQNWESLRSFNSAAYVVQLLAPLPYFYDPTGPVDTSLKMGGTLSGYLRLPTIFPLRFEGSTVYDTYTFANDGEVETWPVFTIYGPIYWPMITNLSDSDLPHIEVQYDLAVGEVIEVDCRPGYMTVTLNPSSDNANLMRYVSEGSEFFKLEPGSNIIQLTGTGAGEADLDVMFYEYYLGL